MRGYGWGFSGAVQDTIGLEDAEDAVPIGAAEPSRFARVVSPLDATNISPMACAAPTAGIPVPSLAIHRPSCSHCSHEPLIAVFYPPYSTATMPMAVPIDWSRMCRAGAAPYTIVLDKFIPATPAGETGDTGVPDVGCDETCNCGPACQCIGCIVHPMNQATQDYITSTWQTGGQRASGLDQGTIRFNRFPRRVFPASDAARA